MSELVGEAGQARRQVMYACTSTYLALCGIWALLFTLYVGLAVAKGVSFLSAIAAIAAILGLAIAWVRSFRIEVSAEGIDYRFPFFRHASVRWSDIVSVSCGAKWPRTKAPSYMVIKTRGGATPVTVNIKVFRRGELVALASAIQRWSPQATVDKATHRMSRGEMPSLFEATRNKE